ncbi:MAG TPA: BsuPI-related putative proteinase inhibitor [Frankiaceae bacterium]|nr:BsuPI-related putative proteinase inhibitor [Frankiaceae bacterium]
MRDRPGDDFAAVRARDLAAATAVVVRFRRRRRATVAAALSVGLAAMLSSRPFYPPSTSSLVPTTEAPPTTTASPGGTVSRSPAPTRPVTTPAAPAGPGVPATGPDTAGAVPPSPGPELSRPPEPGAPPAETRRRASRVPVVRTEDSSGCPDVPLAAVSTGFCLRAEAIQQKRGGAVSLRYTACRTGPRLSDVSLRFATTKEVEFVVVRDGAIIWRWSTGVRFTKSSHTVPVPDCVRWRTLWNGHLDDGTRVPSGRYAVRAAGRDSDDVLYGAAAEFTVAY